MKRKFTIGLNGDGIADLIDALNEYPAWLEERSRELLYRLSQEGYQIAAAGFAKAQYDGVNDSAVSVENRGENVRAVVALGSSVLFIEFGTGVTYPDSHPEAAKNGMIRGGYGQGKGNQTSWGYYGSAGTNGKVLKETDKGSLVITHGNPANMPMYDAVKQLKEKLPEMVKEVFNQ